MIYCAYNAFAGGGVAGVGDGARSGHVDGGRGGPLRGPALRLPARPTRAPVRFPRAPFRFPPARPGALPVRSAAGGLSMRAGAPTCMVLGSRYFLLRPKSMMCTRWIFLPTPMRKLSGLMSRWRKLFECTYSVRRSI